jgi:hypothetical protein
MKDYDDIELLFISELRNPNLTTDKAVISYDSVRHGRDSCHLLILCRTMTFNGLLVKTNMNQ